MSVLKFNQKQHPADNSQHVLVCALRSSTPAENPRNCSVHGLYLDMTWYEEVSLMNRAATILNVGKNKLRERFNQFHGTTKNRILQVVCSPGSPDRLFFWKFSSQRGASVKKFSRKNSTKTDPWGISGSNAALITSINISSIWERNPSVSSRQENRLELTIPVVTILLTKVNNLSCRILLWGKDLLVCNISWICQPHCRIVISAADQQALSGMYKLLITACHGLFPRQNYPVSQWNLMSVMIDNALTNIHATKPEMPGANGLISRSVSQKIA